MKKNMCIFSLVLLVVTHIYADTHINLEGYKHISCEVKPRITRDSNDKHSTHPHIPGSPSRTAIRESNSTNWAGYAAFANSNHPATHSTTHATTHSIAHTVTYVAGTWIVPQLSPSTGTTYCSMWVGIDGYNSPTVEQLGTEHDWVNGRQVNSAWFEMYPQYPFTITGFPANPGDSITASVTYQGNNVFVLTIMNNTQRVVFNVPTSYTRSSVAQRASAEWVAEAPFSNQVLPLSHFGTVNFSNCTATINGIHGAINNAHWLSDALTMVTNNNAVKASVSGLTNNGQNFSVTWRHE